CCLSASHPATISRIDSSSMTGLDSLTSIIMWPTWIRRSHTYLYVPRRGSSSSKPIDATLVLRGRQCHRIEEWCQHVPLVFRLSAIGRGPLLHTGTARGSNGPRPIALRRNTRGTC